MSAEHPNILCIMADQLTAPALPFYGHPIVETPHSGGFTQARVDRATRGAVEYLLKILVFLTSVGKTSREAMIINKPTKIVEKLNVNSRCNRIYKNGIITPITLISTPMDISLQTVKNSGPSERKTVQA